MRCKKPFEWSLPGDDQSESLLRHMANLHCFTSFYQLQAQSITEGLNGEAKFANC